MDVIGIFLIGTVIGSFLNVCIDRLPRGGSLLSSPSQCEACRRRLAPVELIPILSYLALRGHCRTCRSKIELRVPLVELGTGLVFLLVYLRFGVSLRALVAGLFAVWLLVIAVIDLEQKRILNVLTYPGIAVALAASMLVSRAPDWTVLAGGLLAGGALLAPALASRRGMGMGDVKLAALLGFLLGYPIILVGLFLAFVLGGLISMGLLAAGRVGRKETVAFGPYLALGGFLAMLYGADLLGWWLARI